MELINDYLHLPKEDLIDGIIEFNNLTGCNKSKMSVDRDRDRDVEDRAPEARGRRDRAPPPDISSMITLKIDNIANRTT